MHAAQFRNTHNPKTLAFKLKRKFNRQGELEDLAFYMNHEKMHGYF